MYHTTDREGLTEINPGEERLREILDSVDDEEGDASSPEVWLSHMESGWMISVYPGKLLRLENTLRPEIERELKAASAEDILDLWELLATGQIDLVLRERWKARSKT